MLGELIVLGNSLFALRLPSSVADPRLLSIPRPIRAPLDNGRAVREPLPARRYAATSASSSSNLISPTMRVDRFPVVVCACHSQMMPSSIPYGSMVL